MIRCKRFYTYTVIALMSVMLCGCTFGKDSSGAVIDDEAADATYQPGDEAASADLPQTDVSDVQEAEASDNDMESEDEQENIDSVSNDGITSEYYSEDGSVYVSIDSENRSAKIVDGDIEIPVDITMGVYGPKIEKFDVDEDGEDEYIIAECEGSGTGISLYGLCIVQKTDDGYEMTKYSSDHFSAILEEDIGFNYYPATREVHVFEILPIYYDRHTGETMKLSREEELTDIVWTDIIGFEFVDGRVVLTAPSGYMFEGSQMPDYENAVEVRATLRITEDSKVSVFYYEIVEDDGVK